MRKTEYYTGYEITKEVINKVNLIALKRYHESYYSFLRLKYKNLDELCYCNCSKPEETNVVLGEDWYIIYTKSKNLIEINEWVDIEAVPNKLKQTMEMLNALKKILLSSEDKKILATMKHNTSYKFYQSLITRGLLQEYEDIVGTETDMPHKIKKLHIRLEREYGFVEDFLNDPNRNKEQEEILEDYIYHDILFGITDEFKKRYKKQYLK